MKTIPLTQGYVAVVDDEDYERVAQFGWFATVEHRRDGSVINTYAMRKGWDAERKRQTTVMMHRFIMGAPKGTEVDHQDHDGLNNRRSNLRCCTKRQNAQNRRRRVTNKSGFKGVNWEQHVGKWRARIRKDGKLIHLGLYDTAEAAHSVYIEASARLFGEFACDGVGA